MPAFQRLQVGPTTRDHAIEDQPRVRNQSARGHAASVCRRIYTAAAACVHTCAHTLDCRLQGDRARSRAW